MDSLIAAIQQAIVLSPDEQERIVAAFRPLHLSRNEHWISEGQYCHHIAFVASGKLRVHYTDDAGNDITCYFVVDQQFIASFTSFLTKTPTVEHISAIEPAILYVIHRDELEQLSEAIPRLHAWRRIIAENLFIVMEKRIAMLQSQTAHQRYENMLKENPGLLLSVPLQYTASFLGITPQHLSRLRKQVAD